MFPVIVSMLSAEAIILCPICMPFNSGNRDFSNPAQPATNGAENEVPPGPGIP